MLFNHYTLEVAPFGFFVLINIFKTCGQFPVYHLQKDISQLPFEIHVLYVFSANLVVNSLKVGGIFLCMSFWYSTFM